jgi:hypothetical protein
MDVRFDEKGKFFTPRVAKDTLPALIRTVDQVIVGHVYIRPDKRLKDDLSEDASRFLPVTDARVYDAARETLLYHSSLMLVSYRHIVMLSPLDAMEDIRPVPWQAVADQEADS